MTPLNLFLLVASCIHVHSSVNHHRSSLTRGKLLSPIEGSKLKPLLVEPTADSAPKEYESLNCFSTSICPEVSPCKGSSSSDGGASPMSCSNSWIRKTGLKQGSGQDTDAKTCYWESRPLPLQRGSMDYDFASSGRGSWGEVCRPVQQKNEVVAPSLVILHNVYATWTGELFNASHRFILPSSTPHLESSPPEFVFGEDTMVAEVESLVNLFLPDDAVSNGFLELVHRLPLFIQLSSIMPGLRNSSFLLGDYKVKRLALDNILGISPWNRLIRPVQTFGRPSVIFVQELILPLCEHRALSGLWAWSRELFFLAPNNPPLFGADWRLRNQGVVDQSRVTKHRLPPNWIVLQARPASSLAVDAICSEEQGFPCMSLKGTVGGNFWLDRMVLLSDMSDRLKAQGLARRAAVLVTSFGSALELLPFIPKGGVVVLLEPPIETPAEQGSSFKQPGSGVKHNAEARMVASAVRHFASAAGLHLGSVPCFWKSQVPNNLHAAYSYDHNPKDERTLLCRQQDIEAAIDWAASKVYSSPHLPAQSQHSALHETIPGTAIRTWERKDALKKWYSCVIETGKWWKDARPRRLPWNCNGDPDICDWGLLHGSKADKMAVSPSASPEEAASASANWTVREGLKYQWTVPQGACQVVTKESSAAGQGTMEPLSGWVPFSPQAMCMALKGRRRILLIGDSLSEGMAKAFHYNMLRDVNKPVPPEVTQTLLPTSCLNLGLNHVTCVTYMSAVCEAGPRDVQVTHLRNNQLLSDVAGIAGLPKFKVAYFLPWAEELSSIVDAADIIILNKGAHIVPLPRYERELRATLRLLRDRYPNKLMFFRSTVPGQPHCTDFTRPLEKLHHESLPVPFNWGSFAAKNDISRSISEDLGVVYLDVTSMGRLRGDGHKGVKLTNDGRKVSDCLHYCNPGPVDTWVETLFNYLLRLDLEEI